MATSIITPEQAAAILKNGRPYGVGGKTIRVIGLSQKTTVPLYAKTRTIQDPNAPSWDPMRDATTVVDESTQIHLPPIEDLMGGLFWRQFCGVRDKAVSSLNDQGRCYGKDERPGPSGRLMLLPLDDIKIVTIDFSRQELEKIQQRGAGAPERD